jgi:hypothetical protein
VGLFEGLRLANGLYNSPQAGEGRKDDGGDAQQIDCSGARACVCVEGGRGSRQGQSIQSLRLLGGSVGEKAGGSTFPAASQQ